MFKLLLGNHLKMHFKFSILSIIALATVVSGPVFSAETVITSDRLEKRTEGAEDHFFFYDNVRIAATNLVVRCDAMEVVTEGSSGEAGSVPQFGAIETIVARGNVHMDQPSVGRTAKADRAEIFPQKGEVILTGNAEVTDGQGTVKGHRMRLVKGEERAIVEGSAAGERPKVVLPTMPDWELGKTKKDQGDTTIERVKETPQDPEFPQEPSPNAKQIKEAL